MKNFRAYLGVHDLTKIGSQSVYKPIIQAIPVKVKNLIKKFDRKFSF